MHVARTPETAASDHCRSLPIAGRPIAEDGETIMEIQRPTSSRAVISLMAIAGLALALAGSKGKSPPNATPPSDDERGRSAQVPEEIPVRGLRDVFWRLVEEVSDDRVMLIAAGVTFYLLLALFPALAALVSLYGLIADPMTIADHLAKLSILLPPGAFDIVAEQIRALAGRREESLGITFFVGLAFALWSTHSGTLALFDAMNVAYEEKERRGFIRLNLIGLVFTLCAVVGAIAVLGLVAAIPVILSSVWLDAYKENLALIGRWPLLLIIVAGAVMTIYRFAPSREPAKLRWLTWGAALTTIACSAMSLGFGFYLEHFANYNATYGALGALIGLLVWIWLSVTILIVGAELNAELEHQTRKDTTTGAPEPMGARGAYVADTLGRAVD
jgi:membrane protein